MNQIVDKASIVTYHHVLCITVYLMHICHGNQDAKRLYDDLLMKNNYNKMIRPVGNYSEKLTIKLGMRLAQIMNVDEKNEIMETNLWLIHEWLDYSLRWNPQEYGGVKTLYVPSEMIWRPDIVLYNNADGDFVITLMTKATVSYYGKVQWEPPAIFKTQCDINVQYFPFDEQVCHMKFGSWSNDGFSIDFRHIWTEKYGLGEFDILENGVDITSYYESQQWDLMAVPAKKKNKFYPCCSEPFPDITFNFTVRRKALYYAYNLIIPCVSVNFLTILTFLLPSTCGEKISLSVSLMLSLSLFQLLLMEITPSTSLTIPLLGSFILFTMVMVCLSVLVSVITLNVNYRSNTTHKISGSMRTIFMHLLPRLLWLKPYEKIEPTGPDWLYEDDEEANQRETPANSPNPSYSVARLVNDDITNSYDTRQLQNTYVVNSGRFIGMNNLNMGAFCRACMMRKAKSQTLPEQAVKALQATCFIAKHTNEEDEGNTIKEDWVYIALVMDRIFLIIYIAVSVLGGLGILCNAPTLFDYREPLHGIK